MQTAYRVHNVHMTKLLIKRRSAWTLHCTSACGLWRRVKQTSCRKLGYHCTWIKRVEQTIPACRKLGLAATACVSGSCMMIKATTSHHLSQTKIMQSDRTATWSRLIKPSDQSQISNNCCKSELQNVQGHLLPSDPSLNKANLGVVCWGFSRIHVFLIAAPNLNVSIKAIFGLIIGMRNMIGVVSLDRMKLVWF